MRRSTSLALLSFQLAALVAFVQWRASRETTSAGTFASQKTWAFGSIARGVRGGTNQQELVRQPRVARQNSAETPAGRQWIDGCRVDKLLTSNLRGLSQAKPEFTLTLLRHGLTENNKLNVFTGWQDVPLKAEGVEEAREAGRLMKKRLCETRPFDAVFTSELQRARLTAVSALEAGWGEEHGVELVEDWRLNERHYGNLQRLFKDDPALFEKYGKHTVIGWRRGYHDRPPPMEPHHPDYEVGAVRRVLTESLKDCQVRVQKAWEEAIAPRVRRGENILVVGHANTLRALIKALDNITDDDIRAFTVPNGVPIVYHLAENEAGKLVPTDPASDLGWHGDFLVTPENHHMVASHYEVHSKILHEIFDRIDALEHDGMLKGYITKAELDHLTDHALQCKASSGNRLHFDVAGLVAWILENIDEADYEHTGRISWDEFVCAFNAPSSRHAVSDVVKGFRLLQ